jgi:1-acyl-sn-glycerol-3-phosphate acyltransferase
LQNTHLLTRLYRIFLIIIHTIVGISIAAIVFPLCTPTLRLRLTRWWCRRLLTCFRIKVRAFGKLPILGKTHTMFVGNHISWVDIHAINSMIPVRFVAKMEIKDWPVFGYLVRKSGTIFINRNHRKDAARIVKLTEQALRQGDNVCFFPEGTTTEGHHVLPFKSSIIQAAVAAGSTVTPIAIRYPLSNGDINTHMAYAGDISLIDSMQQILALECPVVELHFLTPIHCSNNLSRQTIAHQAFEQITLCLQAPADHAHQKEPVHIV